jgi:hypothetical protein
LLIALSFPREREHDERERANKKQDGFNNGHLPDVNQSSQRDDDKRKSGDRESDDPFHFVHHR